jgi:hypothetical protein
MVSLVQTKINSIILKIPHWLRWLLVIPVAVACDLAAQTIYRLVFAIIIHIADFPFDFVRPYTDEIIDRILAPVVFLTEGTRMAPSHWFRVASCLLLFKVCITLYNLFILSIFVLHGTGMSTPTYYTQCPLWWSFLIHLIFIALSGLIILKDQTIRKEPSPAYPILVW